MKRKEWKLKEKASSEFFQKFSNLPPIIAQLLHNRGFLEKQQAEEFLNPDYQQGLFDPFLFRDMEKAVARIFRALESEETICIYGDYDADAVTANAVLRQTFIALGHQNIFSYIPDRFSEGYGVNLDALEKIKSRGASLILTVDCGTNSIDAALWCKENSVDFIITDHHEILGEEPESLALINPKNPNDKYPFQEIVGVGVAFKLAQALIFTAQKKGYKNAPKAGFEKWLLDLVAIGTVADCHSLVLENRIFVKFGLKVLAKTRWQGLLSLSKTAGLDFLQKSPDTYTLGFVLAPRLNAAGRLEHADIALDLLLETNPEEADQKALQLEEINRRRQDLTMRVLSEAESMADLETGRKVLVLMGQDWPKGVVGLVAGRLAESRVKPSVVLSLENGVATGSARTVGDFDIVEALKESSKYLERFGGHKQAAGLTLKEENFPAFYKDIQMFAEKKISEADLALDFSLDAELEPEDLDVGIAEALEPFAPFGVGNPQPRFWLKNARVLDFRLVGKEGKHLQLNLEVGGEKRVPAIAFNMGFFADSLKDGEIEAACELMRETWNGKTFLKLKIVDIKK